MSDVRESAAAKTALSALTEAVGLILQAESRMKDARVALDAAREAALVLSMRGANDAGPTDADLRGEVEHG